MCNWDLQQPTVYDCFQLIIVLINRRFQDQQLCRTSLDFVKSFEQVGLQLLKVTLMVDEWTPKIHWAASLLQISIDYNKWSSQRFFDFVAQNPNQIDMPEEFLIFKSQLFTVIEPLWLRCLQTDLDLSQMQMKQKSMEVASRILEFEIHMKQQIECISLMDTSFKEWYHQQVTLDWQTIKLIQTKPSRNDHVNAFGK